MELDKKKAQILVLEDERLFREILVEILKRGGFKSIDEAATYDEAIEKIEKNNYDVVLIDIRLGKNQGNGLTLLKIVKDKDPDTQVLMISAHGDVESIMAALRLGACDFVQKPVEIPEVISILVTKAAENRIFFKRAKELEEENSELKSEIEKSKKQLFEAGFRDIDTDNLFVIKNHLEQFAENSLLPVFRSIEEWVIEKYKLSGEKDFTRVRIVESESKPSEFLNFLGRPDQSVFRHNDEIKKSIIIDRGEWQHFQDGRAFELGDPKLTARNFSRSFLEKSPQLDKMWVVLDITERVQ